MVEYRGYKMQRNPQGPPGKKVTIFMAGVAIAQRASFTAAMRYIDALIGH